MVYATIQLVRWSAGPLVRWSADAGSAVYFAVFSAVDNAMISKEVVQHVQLQ